MEYSDKKQSLTAYLSELVTEDVAVAFSGGVDSSLLLKLCCDQAKNTGRKVYAFTFHTKLHPMKDLEIAKKVAIESGASHIVLTVDELDQAGIRFNPPDRCYLCKKSLFLRLKEETEKSGISHIIEGTNGDDLKGYRPGIQAIRELGILSPLAKYGFSKKEVRQLAKEYHISVAGRPSTPCMATRFPYGAELTYEKIKDVESGEEWLREKGFYNVRLRVHGSIARIEVDSESMESLLAMRKEVIEKLSSYGYDYITMDLKGFCSGSMDIQLT
ncbi:MAG: ATP-dependent sacrificial sulfur transferase LarE [Eubacterium sp.]|nr:ATP-dependent sacrificial sulfur transferase LarE [Eubacterium sp.]